MNKIKNIMLTIITAISIILLIGIISYYTEAKSSSIPDNIDLIKRNDKFTYSLTDLSEGRRQGKLFCVQHRQEMSRWKDIDYTVTNIVTIKGEKATAFKKDGINQKSIDDELCEKNKKRRWCRSRCVYYR